MKLKPVLTATKPKYPDKYEIDLNHTLLSYRPKRWITGTLAGVTLTALLAASLSECSASDRNNKEFLLSRQYRPSIEFEGLIYMAGETSTPIKFATKETAYELLLSELKQKIDISQRNLNQTLRFRHKTKQ